MQGQSVLSEITQAIVALVVLVPSMLIVLYEVANGRTASVPDFLAGFDGVVLTFYFARAGVNQVARAVTNGALQGVIAAQANATTTKPTA
jgi:hypothetical protein